MIRKAHLKKNTFKFTFFFSPKTLSIKNISYCKYLKFRTLDEGLAEAISSLIWAAPRLQTDVAELKIISDQLAVKYGKQYALAARENALNSVNEKLVHKLSVQAPSKILVEKYLIGEFYNVH